MYPASLIAELFVRRAIEEGNPITQMKLHKIVYFAQGCHLAVYNQPLIKEVIQAWKYGPVVPAVYDDYKLYGSDPISNTRFVNSISEMKSTNLDEAAKKTMNYTWEATKNQTAESLANWTHRNDSPWKKVYSEFDWAIPIPNNLIKEYFTGFLMQ